MKGRGRMLGKTENKFERVGWLGWVALGMGLMFLATRWNAPLHVDSIFVAYPYNERSLVVDQNGTAELQASGKTMKVRRGTFDADDLFQQLMSEWEPLREGDTQNMGTVRVFYSNDTSGTYFIYHTDYLEEIFAHAQAHVLGDP
jgi:hypothetical protein